MRSLFLLLFTLITFPFYAQKVEERIYHFDNYKVMSVKNNYNRYDYKEIRIQSSVDTSYYIRIIYNPKFKAYNCAYLLDRNRKENLKFKVDFNFKQIQDLSNLKNPTYEKYYDHYDVKYTQYNPSIEKIEYKVDAVKNTTIVYLKRYDNNNFKKIIHEENYLFEKNDQIVCNDSYSIKNYLKNSHNLNIDKDQHLKKISEIFYGDIGMETIYQEIKDVSCDFKLLLK